MVKIIAMTVFALVIICIAAVLAAIGIYCYNDCECFGEKLTEHFKLNIESDSLGACIVNALAYAIGWSFVITLVVIWFVLL